MGGVDENSLKTRHNFPNLLCQKGQNRKGTKSEAKVGMGQPQRYGHGKQEETRAQTKKVRGGNQKGTQER